ncbi:MAG: hypothetical protein SFW62_10090 [Alphaproteobacteria bacterium]|nr:hypothetical protein [Alphaproteobacteria bacterium]
MSYPARPLTEKQIVQWIQLFHEMEGKWPSARDKIIWDKNSAGVWHQIPGTWSSIDQALVTGRGGLLGGSSLNQIKSEYGLCDLLSEEIVERRIKLFREKEDRLPGITDKVVWDKNTKGQWIQVPGSWASISLDLRRGFRGLPGGSSLSKFMRDRGFRPNLNEALIWRWMELFHKKEKRWPKPADNVIWDKNEKGKWITVEGNWNALNVALHNGVRTLPGGSSLAKLKEKYGGRQSKPTPMRPSVKPSIRLPKKSI